MGKHWKDIEANAQAYKTLGIDRVYLSRFDGFEQDFPWHLATEVKEGGSHRLDISTDLSFSCKLDCGITLNWSLDLEPSSANGSGEYQINADGIAAVIGKLQPPCALELRRILADDSVKVRTRGDEYMKIAQRQYGSAAILEKLATA